MNSDMLMARIYLHEADHGKRRTLMEEILKLLAHQNHVQGVVVFRGIAGLGDRGEVLAADLLRLNVDLPLVIEFFDVPEVAEAVLGALDGMVPKGHIVTWRATRR
jgi:PII-like signaling protein